MSVESKIEQDFEKIDFVSNQKLFPLKACGDVKALKNRLNNLIALYLINQYPFRLRVLGFGILEISNSDELKGRVDEVAQWLGISVNLKEMLEAKQ